MNPIPSKVFPSRAFPVSLIQVHHAGLPGRPARRVLSARPARVNGTAVEGSPPGNAQGLLTLPSGSLLPFPNCLYALPQAGPPYPMIVLPKVGGFWIDPPSVEHNDSSSDAVSSSAASTASSTNEQQLDFKVLQ